MAQAFELTFDASGVVESESVAEADSFQWIHLDHNELSAIRARLGQWALAVPESWNHQTLHANHVFCEDYGSFLHLVAYRIGFADEHPEGARPEMSTGALHLIIHERGVITWSPSPAEMIDELHAKMLRYPSWIKGRSALLFAILDAVFDTFYPFLDAVNDLILQLEQKALGNVVRKSLEVQVMSYRHLLLDVRRILSSARDMVRSLAHKFPDESAADYFEAYDRILRLSEVSDGYREMLDTIMDLHLSSVSNRLNEIVKTLTLVTTMMLPASLVAAIYGMNFDHAPGVHWEYGFYCVLGFVAIVSAGLLVWFKRQAWL